VAAYRHRGSTPTLRPARSDEGIPKTLDEQRFRAGVRSTFETPWAKGVFESVFWRNLRAVGCVSGGKLKRGAGQVLDRVSEASGSGCDSLRGGWGCQVVPLPRAWAWWLGELVGEGGSREEGPKLPRIKMVRGPVPTVVTPWHGWRADDQGDDMCHVRCTGARGSCARGRTPPGSRVKRA